MAYVKLEDAIKKVDSLRCECDAHFYHEALTDVKSELLEMSTADVVDVKHGEWTSVKEGLPRSRRRCLCICAFGENGLQYYDVLLFHPEKDAENGYVTGPHFSNEGVNGMRVLHWMPLPKPPCGAE